MNILLSGSTGLIGSELAFFLSGKGHRIIRLVRGAQAEEDEVRWDPASGTLDPQHLEHIDAVVNLAGENILSGRWTREKKRRICESRIKGTQLLAQAMSRLFDPPKVFVSVSAIGYYGDRGDEKLNEESEAGAGFLPELCRQWEAATEVAIIRGIRVVIPRLGMVLSPKGGALGLMLPVFRLGMGGRIGTGRQYQSWITIEDLLEVIAYAIQNDWLHGPINAVSPNPATNLEFAQALGRVLSRPVRFSLPSFAARIAFGKMADEVLLASARVSPARLVKSGFNFKFPELENALRHLLQPPMV